nr:Rdx family protein [Bacillus sp. HNG]
MSSLELVPSSGGIFEVTVDGEKVFSKKEIGRFPLPEEIISTMEQA